MCGFAGVFNFGLDQRVDEDLIHNMTSQVTHRGPDDSGVFVSGPIGLGFRRLSVIDLSNHAQQPMLDEKYDLALVFNGEIYNFREIRKELVSLGYDFKSRGDAEVLLRAFRHWGKACLDHIEGMFAFALWDGKKKELFIARDHFGIKPLHYYLDDKRFIFASETKAILEVPGISRDQDPIALRDYLSHMQIPAPRTIYKHIKKLLPAQSITINMTGKTNQSFYWKLSVGEDYSKSEEDYQGELVDLFNKSIKRHMVADVPTGVFLSGGFDSSSVAAFAARNQQHPIKTFSVIFPKKHSHNEQHYQKIISNKYNTEHHEYEITESISDLAKQMIRQSDEPYAISSALALLGLCKVASREVKVVLSGDGADELFAGYHNRLSSQWYEKLLGFPKGLWKQVYDMSCARHSDFKSNSYLMKKIKNISLFAQQSKDERFISKSAVFTQDQQNKLLKPELLEEPHSFISEFSRHLLSQAPNDSINRYLYLDSRAYLSDHMFTKLDNCTSMVGIEGRVPFLDLSLAKAAFRIPVKYKFKKRGKGKELIKGAFRDYVPSEISNRNKWGFNIPDVDYAGSIPLHDILDGCRDICKLDELEFLIKQYQQGEGNWSRHIWVLYNYALWKESIS